MSERAQVTSVEALEALRSDLIVYLGKARGAVEDVSSEVPRARNWLENTCSPQWERELRARKLKLEEAQNELFSARLAGKNKTVSPIVLMAVQRAERAVREAEAKLKVIKKWDRELENQAEPMIKQIDMLQGFLTGEMPGAVAYLTQIIKTLEAYAETGPGPRSQPAGGGESA
jgi:hypothetical protein